MWIRSGLLHDRRARRRGNRSPDTLCVASAAAIGVAGAGVILMSGGRALGNVCVSNSMTAIVEELQYTLGEGPCVDAFHTKAPVLAPDLEHADEQPLARVSRGAEVRRRAGGVRLPAADRVGAASGRSTCTTTTRARQ